MTVSFGAPLPPTVSAHEVRQAIQELSADASAHRATTGDTPGVIVRSGRGTETVSVPAGR